MAIVTQYPYTDEEGITHSNLVKTYSDENFKIVQVETGLVYEEAVDIYPSRYTYEETNEQIEVPEEETEEETEQNEVEETEE